VSALAAGGGGATGECPRISIPATIAAIKEAASTAPATLRFVEILRFEAVSGVVKGWDMLSIRCGKRG
jgi:hypothetical protein